MGRTEIGLLCAVVGAVAACAPAAAHVVDAASAHTDAAGGDVAETTLLVSQYVTGWRGVAAVAAGVLLAVLAIDCVAKRHVAHLPGPAALPLVGHIPWLIGAPWATFSKWAQRYGGVYTSFVWTRPFIIVSSPAGLRRVLRDNASNYLKDPWSYHIFKGLLGNGLVTAEGAQWRKQKRRIGPLFHHSALGYVMPIFTRAGDRLARRWLQAPRPDGEPASTQRRVELGEFFRHLTLEVISEAALGLGSEHAAVFPPLFLAIIDELNSHVWEPWRAWLPTRARRELHARQAELDGIIGAIITARRKQLGVPAPGQGKANATAGDAAAAGAQAKPASGGGESAPSGGSCLLDMLLLSGGSGEGGDSAGDAGASDGNGNSDAEAGMTDTELADELKTMLLAGHETSSMSLTWALYLLLKHPEEMARARAEVDAALPLDGYADAATYRGLTFVGYALDEAMRLITPVPLVTRLLREDDEVDGYRLPGGARLAVNMWAVHHDPDVWGADVDDFRPQRFAPEEARGRHPFAFIPFSGGPRQCMGRNFAILEAKVLLGTLLRRFDVSLEPGHGDAELDSYILPVRPRDGMWLRVSPRDR